MVTHEEKERLLATVTNDGTILFKMQDLINAIKFAFWDFHNVSYYSK